MPATCKRRRKHQVHSGNHKRTELTARPPAAAAGRGGDGDGVDSPADFPYNLCDKTWRPEPEIRIRQNACGSCGQKL